MVGSARWPACSTNECVRAQLCSVNQRLQAVELAVHSPPTCLTVTCACHRPTHLPAESPLTNPPLHPPARSPGCHLTQPSPIPHPSACPPTHLLHAGGGGRLSSLHRGGAALEHGLPAARKGQCANKALACSATGLGSAAKAERGPHEPCPAGPAAASARHVIAAWPSNKERRRLRSRSMHAACTRIVYHSAGLLKPGAAQNRTQHSDRREEVGCGAVERNLASLRMSAPVYLLPCRSASPSQGTDGAWRLRAAREALDGLNRRLG